MLDTQDIKDINKIVTGHGDVLNETMLESALSSFHYYETEEEQVCSIWRGLIKNHSFRDGNKRTALICLSVMCDLIGLPLHMTNSEAFKYTLDVANSNMYVEDIAKMIFPS
jgi:death-on-curing protein